MGNTTTDPLCIGVEQQIFSASHNNIKARRSSCKIPDVFAYCWQELDFLDRLLEASKTSNSMKIIPVGAQFDTRQQTDGRTELS